MLNELDTSIYFEASRHFHTIPNLRKGLLWIRENHEGLIYRVEEFERTLLLFNTMLEQKVDDSMFFLNFSRFNKVVGDDGPPTLHQLLSMYTDRNNSQDYEAVGKLADNTYQQVFQKCKSKEWGFPTTIIDNPNQVASGMLIEGYGLMVEQMYQIPGLSRQFVLAFEEVLLAYQPDSGLLNDVIEWMNDKAEIIDFSPDVRILIKKKYMSVKNGIVVSAECNHRTIADKDKSGRPVKIFENNLNDITSNSKGMCFACGRNCGSVTVTGKINEKPGQDPEMHGKIVVEPDEVGERPTLRKTP